MKLFLTILLSTVFLACSILTIQAQESTPPEHLTFKAAGADGPVNFPHKDHMEYAGECNYCHHKGFDAGKCHNCHGPNTVHGVPKAKVAFHTLCIECHHFEQNGPRSCTDCHKK
ncbi:MAG: cytochrome c family protein [Proteobacteria bacterium]|nr:cytochrome c family protein [Pseudomonadota bacterium]MBU1714234.1 cytochrome c family protein [Pseudomonadota bacterium]